MNGYGHKLMDLADVRLLEIPFFQRAYVWDDTDFKALIESFIETDGGKMPFFGSLILKYIKEDNDDEIGKHYLVIDGQQRITTFNILIRVLLDIIKNDADETGSQTYKIKLDNKICTSFHDFLYIIGSDENLNNTYKLRLVPADVDEKAFKIVLNEDYKKRKDNIAKFKENLNSGTINKVIYAYEYFFDYFSNAQNIKVFMDVCRRLINQANSLIWIILDDSDDEQKIFNSVNSLGKNLTSADIIKNNIFQKLKEKAKEKENPDEYVKCIYTENWTDIFDETQEKRSFWYGEITVGRMLTNNLEMFLKDYAIIKLFYSAKDSGGFGGLNRSYAEHIKQKELADLQAFIEELCSYAQTFYEYKKAYADNSNFTWDDYVNRLLLIMDCMDTTTFDPYILKVMKESPDDKQQKLFNLERFFLKRFIYNAQKNNYNQCCETLIKRINEGQTDLSYFDSYMTESPVQNETYKTKFRNLTNGQGRLLIYLLEMIERKEKGERYYSNALLDIRKYSLEHIMPKQWKNNWLDVESEDEYGKAIDKNDSTKFIDTRNMAVKSIGNFAMLTGSLNAKIGDASFKMKINGNGQPKGEGIRSFAGSLKIPAELIKMCDEGKQWNEKYIFEYEKAHFDKLNEYYGFEENVSQTTEESSQQKINISPEIVVE